MKQEEIPAWLRAWGEPEGVRWEAPGDWGEEIAQARGAGQDGAAAQATSKPTRGKRAVGKAPQRAWVRLRPLTWGEALRREALAYQEEYEVDEAGVVRRIVRRFDAEAARRFDLRQGLVSFRLPLRSETGEVEWLGAQATQQITAETVERLLAGLPTGLAGWLEECLEEINARRPQDRAALAEVKKS